LVTWLEKNRNEEFIDCPEDRAIGEMLRSGGRGKIFVNLGMQVMDHPAQETTDWSRDFGDDVILVHRLKTVNLQGDAIEYFLGDGHSNNHKEEKWARF